MSEKYSLADVQGAVAAVKYGHDPVAADNLIRHFATLLDNGDLFAHHNLSGMEREFLRFVGMGFGRYADLKEGKKQEPEGKQEETEGKQEPEGLKEGKKSRKVSLDAAFGLKRSPGQRNRPDTTERDIAIAAFVMLKMRDGSRWQDSVGDAVNKFFDDGDTVFFDDDDERDKKRRDKTQTCNRAYARYRDAMRGFPSEDLEALYEYAKRLLQDDALEDLAT